MDKKIWKKFIFNAGALISIFILFFNVALADDTASLLSALTGSSSSSSGLVYPTNTGLPDPSGGVKQILSNLLSWLLGIVGILALLSFAISGAMYLLSAGNDDMTKRAKETMVASILGVIVSLSGLVLIHLIDSVLRASSSSSTTSLKL